MSNNLVVVGATSGLGEGITHEFHWEGWDVYPIARDEIAVKELADRLELDHYGVADVCEPDTLEDLLPDVAEFAVGGLSLVVNCAGANAPGHVSEIGTVAARRAIDVNATGTINVADAFRPMLRASRGLHVAVASYRNTPNEAEPAYAASQAAATTYIEGVAFAERRHGVGYTVLLPGALETEMKDEFGHREPRPNGLKHRSVAKIIMDIHRWHTFGASTSKLDLHSIDNWTESR